MAYSITVSWLGTANPTGAVASLLVFTGGVFGAYDTGSSNSIAGATPPNTISAGSFIPAGNGEPIVAFVGTFGDLGNPVSNYVAGTGFTLENLLPVNAVSDTAADEQLVQTTAAAINPSMSWTNVSGNSPSIIQATCFSHSGGTASFSQKLFQSPAMTNFSLSPSTPTLGDLLVLNLWSSGGLAANSNPNVFDSQGTVWTLARRFDSTDGNGSIWTYYAQYAQNATVAVTSGQNATFAVNAPTGATGTANVALTGENATFKVGNITVSAGTVVPAITGRNATFSVGTITATGTSTKNIPGSMFHFGWGRG